MTIKHLFASILMLAVPAFAYASEPVAVPEPETLVLLAVGAAAIVIARWRRNK
jgi:hypothetical protein